MSVKISNLPPATSLSADDLTVIVQGGITKNIPAKYTVASAREVWLSAYNGDIVAALGALGVNGGTLRIDADAFTLPNAPVVITTPVRIVGTSLYLSILQKSVDQDAFQVNTATGRVTFENVWIRYMGVDPVAAAGIRWVLGDFWVMKDVFVAGFYDNVAIENCLGWYMQHCYIVTPQRYGLRIRNIAQPDGGDPVMVGNQFDTSLTTSAAAVRYESGGGLKMVDNKITKHRIGLDIQMADGCDTSVFTAVGNSIEAQNDCCVRVGQMGTTGHMYGLTFTGNQLNGITGPGTATNIFLIGAGVEEGVIAFNVIRAPVVAACIEIENTDNWMVAQNSMSGGYAGVYIHDTAHDVYVRDNKFRDQATPVIDQQIDSGSVGLVVHDLVQEFTTVSDVLWTQMYRVHVPDRAACHLIFTFTGTAHNGVSGFVHKVEGTLHQVVGGGPLLWTSYDNQITGPELEFRWVLDAAPQAADIQIRMKNGNGAVAMSGRGRVQGFGNLERLMKMAGPVVGLINRVAQLFTGKPDGPITLADTGQTWDLVGSPQPEGTPRILNGKMTNVNVNTDNGAGYANCQLSGNVNKVGGRFTLGPTTTPNSGSACLIIWKTLIPYPVVVPDSPCHLVFTDSLWLYGVFNDQVLTVVASGWYAVPLTCDGATVYTVEVNIVGNTATITLPDGSTETVTDARIGANAGPWSCHEIYANHCDTDSRVAFVEVWAESP
jgi:hypothetical protein